MRGAANISLPASADLFGSSLVEGELVVDWSDTLDPGALSVSLDTDASVLENLRNLSPADIAKAVAGAIDQFLQNLEGFSVLDSEIPGVGSSINDLLDIADTFELLLERYEDEAVEALDELEESLETIVETALGMTVSPDDTNVVEFEFDVDTRTLTVDIDAHLSLIHI